MIFLKRLSFLVFSVLLLTSCKKSTLEEIVSNAEEAENTEPNEYYPLAVGNYWVYENKIFSNGTYYNPISTDSLIVSEIVRIEGKDYFRLEEYHRNNSGCQTQICYLRYKNGAVVHSDGSVRFEKPDFSYSYDTTIGHPDLLRTYSFYIKEVHDPVQTSNSSYTSCIDYKGAEVTLDPIVYPEDNKRYIHHYYAKNIGLIKDYCPFPLNQQTAEVKELVRYHIEP
jgi:hypothetical protein